MIKMPGVPILRAPLLPSQYLGASSIKYSNQMSGEVLLTPQFPASEKTQDFILVINRNRNAL
jgi:hypothetical protein